MDQTISRVQSSTLIRHLIDGRKVESRETFQTLNPSTNEPIADVASGGDDEIDAAVRAAKTAFPAWASMPAPKRSKLMLRLAELIDEDVEAIARLESADTGQSYARTRNLLIPRAADNFRFFADMCLHVDGHTYPTADHLNYTIYQPVGVFGLIADFAAGIDPRCIRRALCRANQQHQGRRSAGSVGRDRRADHARSLEQGDRIHRAGPGGRRDDGRRRHCAG